MKKRQITVAQEVLIEKMKKPWLRQLRNENPETPFIELMAILNDNIKTAIDKKEVKPLTKKEEAKITAAIKAERANLFSLPAPPFEKIVPAPGISQMNAIELYIYVSPRYVNILALPEMAGCSPSVPFVKAISDALYPYALMDGRKMNDADLNTRDTLTEQCKTQFQLMMLSCALLANGNKSLFLLTGVACKRKGSKNTIQTTPPTFRLETNKGRGRLGVVVINGVEFAEDYTIFFGPGRYEKATWDSIRGGQRQVIEGQTPGAELNVIVRANGKGGTATDTSVPQTRNVPFD